MSQATSPAVDGMGITCLLVHWLRPPHRIARHGMRLPQLPTAKLVYSCGRRSNSRLISELADYLADSLTSARSVGPATLVP